LELYGVHKFDRVRVAGFCEALRLRLAGTKDVKQAFGWWIALQAGVSSVLTEIKTRIWHARLPADLPAQTLARATIDQPVQKGILFIGYVEAELGLGQSLRGLIKAAEESSLPFAILPYNHRVERRYAGPFHPERYDRVGRYAVNVIEVAPDQVDDLLHAIGPERRDNSYTVLRSYWELATVPSTWHTSILACDEIWAASAFVAEAFRACSTAPVVIIPPAVDVTIGELTQRSGFGLKADVFYFTFSFDLASYPKRKNPFGLISAFQLAFPNKSDKVGLILKYNRVMGLFEVFQSAIKLVAKFDARIVVFDTELTRDEMLSLLVASDAYVSLHRSEGLGLGLIEAMMLGRPVIATDYSGSRDFLTPATGFPVRYTLVPVDKYDYPHALGQVWAEPDLQHAAELMRLVHQARAEVAAVAKVGQAAARARYGLSSVAATISRRIDDIFAATASR
jgi:glycosyltransferase involved in cell wall biosynthesis